MCLSVYCLIHSFHREGQSIADDSCKQVLTIALAVFLFDLQIAPTNAIGIVLTLIGGVSIVSAILRRVQADSQAWYGYVEYTEKKKKSMKLAESK